jgi:hypothetical protein
MSQNARSSTDGRVPPKCRSGTPQTLVDTALARGRSGVPGALTSPGPQHLEGGPSGLSSSDELDDCTQRWMSDATACWSVPPAGPRQAPRVTAKVTAKTDDFPGEPWPLTEDPLPKPLSAHDPGCQWRAESERGNRKSPNGKRLARYRTASRPRRAGGQNPLDDLRLQRAREELSRSGMISGW